MTVSQCIARLLLSEKDDSAQENRDFLVQLVEFDVCASLKPERNIRWSRHPVGRAPRFASYASLWLRRGNEEWEHYGHIPGLEGCFCRRR
jgi:hypothetical protein